MNLIAVARIVEKIWDEHQVTLVEVEEAFSQMQGKPVVEKRVKNRSHPATVWFIAPTFEGRLLKVVVIWDATKQIAILRTAYEPDEQEIEYWNQN